MESMAYSENEVKMWQIFREHKLVFLLCSLVMSAAAMVAVELAFPPMFKMMRPALGGMTLVVMELLGAMLIDLPLAAVVGIMIAVWIKDADERHGIVAGFTFLTVITCSIFVFIAINQIFQFSAIYKEITPVVAQARTKLGARLPVFILLFFIFDYFACAVFAKTGVQVGRLVFSRGKREKGEILLP